MQRCVTVLVVVLLLVLGVACARAASPEPKGIQPLQPDRASTPAAVQLHSTSINGSTGAAQPSGRTIVEGAGSDTLLAAALVIFDAVPMADCQTNNPQRKQCVDVHTVESASRGIASVTVGDAAGIGGFVGVLGLDASGHWQSWFGTQNDTYHLLTLPGQMLICAGGDALNVRSAADAGAPIVGTLPDRTLVTAEQFTLTHPEQETERGSGWYRLSAPLSGWASSDFLSNASNDPYCRIHDIQAHS